VKRWLDSAYPPNAIQVNNAKAAGYAGWAGYFAGRNILNGWAFSDFSRVQEGGLETLAYCSGWSDPLQMKGQSATWGVPICLDVEGGIRGNGSWVQDWLNRSGAGLYGNPPVFVERVAAFYVLAAYPGYNPNASWPSNLPRPNGPCAWQWTGSHSMWGITVDSTWSDDNFPGVYGSGGGTIGGINLADYGVLITDLHSAVARLEVTFGTAKPDGTGPATQQPNWIGWSQNVTTGLAAIETAIAKIVGMGGISSDQQQQLNDIEAVVKDIRSKFA
jgi:hypothetical protein